MTKLFFILLAVNILICSCNRDNNRTIDVIIDKDTTTISEKELIFYEIENETLVKEIEMFLDSMNSYSYMKKLNLSLFEEELNFDNYTSSIIKRKNRIVGVTVTEYRTQLGNITLYILYYPLNPPYFFSTFSKVNDIMVVINYDFLSDIKLPDNVMWKYLKDYFPDQYKLYQKSTDSIRFFITGGGLEWRLTFKDGRLIDKEEVITGG